MSEASKKYLQRFTMGNPNGDNVLADQIYFHFGKQLAFPRIMKIIKEHGRKATYEIWNEVAKGDSKNPIALFLWKIKQNKITWQ